LGLACQECPQPSPGVEKPAHHGANRNSQDFRYLTVIQFAVHVEHERPPVRLGKALERRLNLAALVFSLQPAPGFFT